MPTAMSVSDADPVPTMRALPETAVFVVLEVVSRVSRGIKFVVGTAWSTRAMTQSLAEAAWILVT